MPRRQLTLAPNTSERIPFKDFLQLAAFVASIGISLQSFRKFLHHAASHGSKFSKIQEIKKCSKLHSAFHKLCSLIVLHGLCYYLLSLTPPWHECARNMLLRHFQAQRLSIIVNYPWSHPASLTYAILRRTWQMVYAQVPWVNGRSGRGIIRLVSPLRHLSKLYSEARHHHDFCYR